MQIGQFIAMVRIDMEIEHFIVGIKMAMAM
jgi:hypothetical protein